VKLALIRPVLAAGDDARNMEAVRRIAGSIAGEVGEGDLLLLPEHVLFSHGSEPYDGFLREIAALAGCTVVGGSHHRLVGDAKINYGAVVSPDGRTVAEYSKLRPYFHEQKQVRPGTLPGHFTVGGKRVLVLVCADFWYSDIVLGTPETPDLLLVPALSVSRKPAPGYSRSLWRHLAVARAYEFGVYVGISDWGEGSSLPKNRTCGVSGLADPTTDDPEKFFVPVPEGGARVTTLDFDALDAFREDRRMRGFFWK